MSAPYATVELTEKEVRQLQADAKSDDRDTRFFARMLLLGIYIEQEQRQKT